MNRLPTLVVALLLSLTMASCGLLEDDAPSAKEVNSSDRVEVDGVSFEKPENWLAVEPDDLAEGADDESMDEVYDALGTDADAFAEILEQFDVYLVDTIGATNGFADNISVVGAPGPVPDEGALEAQYDAVGATDVVVERVDSAVGEVLTGQFSIDLGKLVAHGESIVVEQGDDMVVITVSAQRPAVLEKLAAGVLDTLDEE